MSTESILQRFSKPHSDTKAQATSQPLKHTQSATDAIDVPSKDRSIDIITAELLSYKNSFGVSAYMIGRLLLEAKGQLKENELWLEWLHHKAVIPERTAQRLMRLVKGYPNPTALSDLGMTKALTLLTLPEDVRDAFRESTHEVNGATKSLGEMSCREVEKAVREHNSKLNGNASPNNKPDEQFDSADTRESETPDPVTFLLGSITHLERTINNMLEILTTEIDNPEEFHEANSLLRRILNETLQKLPPIKSVNERPPA